MIDLEALDGPPPEDRRVGFRCHVRHPDLGRCDKLLNHAFPPDSDEWHHVMTDYQVAVDGTVTSQHWRWRGEP